MLELQILCKHSSKFFRIYHRYLGENKVFKHIEMFVVSDNVVGITCDGTICKLVVVWVIFDQIPAIMPLYQRYVRIALYCMVFSYENEPSDGSLHLSIPLSLQLY